MGIRSRRSNSSLAAAAIDRSTTPDHMHLRRTVAAADIAGHYTAEQRRHLHRHRQGTARQRRQCWDLHMMRALPQPLAIYQLGPRPYPS